MKTVYAVRPCAIALFCLFPLIAAGQSGAQVQDSSGQAIRSSAGQCLGLGSAVLADEGARCGDRPEDSIVLLPGSSDSPGAVFVKSSNGRELLLSHAYATAQVSQSGALKATQSTEDAISKKFGPVLGAMPARPVSFTVHFATGSSDELTPESMGRISALRAELLRRIAPEIVVIGHTDTEGNSDKNDELSVRRAETVKRLLLEKGVQAESWETAGRGERELLVPTAKGVREEKNRRVEISVR